MNNLIKSTQLKIQTTVAKSRTHIFSMQVSVYFPVFLILLAVQGSQTGAAYAATSATL